MRPNEDLHDFGVYSINAKHKVALPSPNFIIDNKKMLISNDSETKMAKRVSVIRNSNIYYK